VNNEKMRWKAWWY